MQLLLECLNLVTELSIDKESSIKYNTYLEIKNHVMRDGGIYVTSD